MGNDSSRENSNGISSTYHTFLFRCNIPLASENTLILTVYLFFKSPLAKLYKYPYLSQITSNQEQHPHLLTVFI